MKYCVSIIVSLVFSSCASFIKTSVPEDASFTRKTKIKVLMQTEVIEGDSRIVISPNDVLIREANSTAGCNLRPGGQLMQESATVYTAYAFRLMCEVFFNLKKHGATSFELANNENASHESLRLNIIINNNESIPGKVWQTVNFVTLSVIPFWSRREYKVIGKYSAPSKEQEIIVSAEILDVRQLLLLFAMPFLYNPYSATKEVHEFLASGIIGQLNSNSK